jgi:hypothetical protein
VDDAATGLVEGARVDAATVDSAVLAAGGTLVVGGTVVVGAAVDGALDPATVERVADVVGAAVDAAHALAATARTVAVTQRRERGIIPVERRPRCASRRSGR